MTTAKTNQQFLNEVKEKTNGEYVPIEPYVSSFTKIHIKHLICGNILYTTPNNFLHVKAPCPCARTLTNDDFLKRLQKTVGDEYTPLDKYTSSKNKIRLKHNQCNTILNVTPNAFFSDGIRCKKCSKHYRKALSNERFQEKLNKVFHGEYILISEYIGYDKPMTVKNTKCGHEFSRSYANLKRAPKCPICSKMHNMLLPKYNHIDKSKIYSKRAMQAILNQEFNYQYVLMEEYKGYLEPMLLQDLDCNHIFRRSLNALIVNRKCPMCYKNQKIQDKLDNISPNTYTLFADYDNNSKPIMVKNNYCHHVYSKTLENFKKYPKCPICNKLEQMDKKALEVTV